MIDTLGEALLAHELGDVANGERSQHDFDIGGAPHIVEQRIGPVGAGRRMNGQSRPIVDRPTHEQQVSVSA